MKTSYFILLISLLLSCTPIKWVTTPKVGEIIDVPGTKDELYIRANQWMVRHFKSAKSVIQFQDKEAGKIMGKYLMNTIDLEKAMNNLPITNDVYTLITISVKDNATRIDIEPLEYWPYNKRVLTYSPEMAQRDIKVLIDGYKNFISVKEDVWQKSESTNPKSNVTPIDLKKKTNKKAKTKDTNPVPQGNNLTR